MGHVLYYFVRIYSAHYEGVLSVVLYILFILKRRRTKILIRWRPSYQFSDHSGTEAHRRRTNININDRNW